MSRTLRAFWEARVDATPSAPFLVYDGTTQRYAEFDASVNRIAHGLLRAGVHTGEKVALLLGSDLSILRLELALQKLGAVMVPIIASYTRDDVNYVLGHCGATRLITDADGWATIELGGGLDVAQAVRVHFDAAEFETDDESRPPAIALEPHDPMAIMYTSGSTGRPKGVTQPTAGFESAGRAIAERLAGTAEDNWFSALPLFHTAATHMILAPAIASAARFTLIPRFSRDRFWKEVRASGGTHSLLMPAQLSILMTAPPRDDDRDHTMRVIFSHIRPEAFVDRFGVDVCTTWAMTETSGMGTMMSPGATDYAPKLIGKPMPPAAEIKVVDGSGTEVARGELGELCFRHPDVMLAYYEDAENTAASLRDGWVHSGDLCSMDEEGNAYFHGRLKHMIKRGGENIAGEEVEFTIMAHPAVEECIVVGVEDPIYTEEVHASVQVRTGQDLTEADVVEWCSERLSSWKVPRYVELRREEFPKLANGKTNRRAIKAAVDPAAAWDRLGEAART